MTSTPQKTLYEKSQIQAAVKKMAGDIGLWLGKSGAKAVNLISVLEGAREITRDLSEALSKEHPHLEIRVHEVWVKGTDGTKLLKDRQVQSSFPTPETLGPHPVLVVDDLLDSGFTLKLLKKELEGITSAPIKTAALVRKFEESACELDFCGFEMGLNLQDLAAKGLKDCWLFGYGMDLDGLHRDLDYIGFVEIQSSPK